MTASLKLSPFDRLLVFAPHPDDETLASGMLIQSALAVGAVVRVVFVTDGDNNPWPQRWLERRWSIGSVERAWWGQRRRREAAAALALLGVNSAGSVSFLGFPDQGLTDCLMRDDAAVATLREEISRFEPTHVAMPSLADRHPDHSALRVLLDLALLRVGADCVRLGYVVHGEKPEGDSRFVAAEPLLQQRKRDAMEAYASQVALSRRRLLALAARPERFEVTATATHVHENVATLRIPRASSWSLRRHDLLLVVATKKETLRFRVALGMPPFQASEERAADAHGISIQSGATALNVMLPHLAAPLAAVYAKIDRAGPRLVIFDRERWHEACDLLPAPVPPLKSHAAASLG